MLRGGSEASFVEQCDYVIPAKAGIHLIKILDSRLRGNDNEEFTALLLKLILK